MLIVQSPLFHSAGGIAVCYDIRPGYELINNLYPFRMAHIQGDVVSLDIGAIFMGFQGDAAVTVGVGEISPQARHLIETAQGALDAGIAATRSGARLGDISTTIQNYAESRGYSVVREYTGHGIGREMHEDPQIPNFGIPGTGPVLKRGMTLALEPMLNVGDWLTRLADDRWTVLTADGSLSAHFEHMHRRYSARIRLPGGREIVIDRDTGEPTLRE